MESRHRYLTIAIFLLVFLAMAVLYGRAIIESDGITYYALTHSLIHDRDFDLTNQSDQFQDLRLSRRHRAGKIESRYSCGFAFLYAPFLIIVEFIPGLSTFSPYAQNIIFPFPDAFGVFIGSVLFGLFSILLAYKMLRDLGENSGPALLMSFAIFCGTPLIYYAFTIPSFVHVSDTFLFSVIFYLAIRKDPIRLGKIHCRNVLLGLLLGLSVLLRNINVFFIFPIVGGLIYFEKKQKERSITNLVLELIAGALPMLLIQLHFNWSQYGTILATGYKVPRTNELNEALDVFGSFGRFGFHPSMGLFIWSPITLLSLCGLIVGCKKQKPHVILASICIFTVIASICFFRLMWQGNSFGNRFLTHLYIFWVVGLYEVVLVWRKKTIIPSTILVLWTFLLFNLFYINLASQRGTEMLADSRKLSPLKLIQTGLLVCEYNDSVSNPFIFWYRSLGTRPAPSLYYLIFHPESRTKLKLRKKENS